MILLIDDRTYRQQKALLQNGYRLEEHVDIIESVSEKDRYEELFSELQKREFDFDRYDFIISHASAFDEQNSTINAYLKEECQKREIPLVMFSGGQDVTYFDREHLYAQISSLTLYHHNLKLFLESRKADKEERMLILLYGTKWQLYILLRVLEKTNLYIQKSSSNSIFYKRFALEVELESLDNIQRDFYKPEVEGKYSNIEEIKKLYNDIKTYLYKVIDG